MRLVGTLSHENEARRLSRYLASQQIANSCEVSFDPPTGQMAYQIWVHDEDKIQAALTLFEAYQKAPFDPQYDAPIPAESLEQIEEENLSEEEPEAPPPRRFKACLTHFLLALCSLIFFLNTLQEIPLRKEGLSESTFLMTPIQALFMFDLPPAFTAVEKIIEEYELSPEQQIPPEVMREIERAERAPFWHGLYGWVLLKIKGEDSSLAQGPFLYRIRQGEVWRLFTPCLLHTDLLHILFNMLWLWYLGRPIEKRIGLLRTLSLTLGAGIGSNLLQYAMSGPFFIGYSGIVMGLAGFIWMREKMAPWEGYPLNRTTILFLLFFIGAIFFLQIAAFFIQIFWGYHFAPNIANTAHISGAIIGALLARFSFFAQKVPR